MVFLIAGKECDLSLLSLQIYWEKKLKNVDKENYLTVVERGQCQKKNLKN